MKKLIISFVVVFSITIIYVVFSQPKTGDDLGTITIQVVDQSGELVINEELIFDEEMSLYDLLQEEFEIACGSASYTIDNTCAYASINGHIILQIGEVSTDWYSSYLKIYIDDIDSNYGVDNVMLEDGVVYKFEYISLGGDGS